MLYLAVPSYPDPQQAGTTIPAYLVISGLSADFAGGTASLTALVYRSLAAAAAGAEPIDRVTVQAGGRPVKFPPASRTPRSGGISQTGAIMPVLSALQAGTQAHWDGIAQALLTDLATLEAFTGGTVASV